MSDELWEAAHARLRTARTAYLRSVGGQPHGRPTASSSASKYLLTGLAECAACGGGMIVRSHDYQPRRYAYRCGYHHQRGRTVCTNSLEAPMAVANRAVLETIERHFLRPEITEAAVVTALEALLPADDIADRERTALLTQLRQVGAELERLATAIAEGGDLPALLEASKHREARRARLEAQLLMLEERPKSSHADRSRLERDLRHRLDDWRGLLTRHPEHGREVLQTLLVGRLRFTPRPERGVYEFAGRGSFGALLSGRTRALVTPAGFERNSIAFHTVIAP